MTSLSRNARIAGLLYLTLLTAPLRLIQSNPLNKAGHPSGNRLSREEVESHFEGELLKRQQPRQNSAQQFRFLDPTLRTATLDNCRAQA